MPGSSRRSHGANAARGLLCSVLAVIRGILGRPLTDRSRRRSRHARRRLGDDDSAQDDERADVADDAEPLADREADDARDDRLELEDHRGAARLDEALAPELQRERERAAQRRR